MTEDDLKDQVYHVFWVDEGSVLTDRVVADETYMSYRKCTHRKHLLATLKKNFGETWEVKEAINEKRLRVVMGVELRLDVVTVTKSSNMLGDIEMEGPC